MNRLDWNQLQTFIAVARHGSLSAASRNEGIAQPTASRHISQLEQHLGYRVFERSKSGVSLTQAGERLLANAEEMAKAAARLEISSQPTTQTLTGTVRVTASRIVAAFILPEILTRFHTIEPGIDIELVASDQTDNLLHREADIAIRMFRPNQLDVVTRKIADLEIGMYAAETYVERRGVPKGISDLNDHDFIGYDRSTLVIDGFRKNGVDIDRDFFTFRSDDQVVCWAMVVAGFGIGFNQTIIGDPDSRIRRILPDIDITPLPVWLTAHPEMKANRRIRRVYDFLAGELGNLQ